MGFLSTTSNTLLGITTVLALTASSVTAASVNITRLRPATVLTSELSQNETNGLSLLGTFKAPKFPKFLTNNPLPYGYPWGQRTANSTNPYTSAPNTGVIRSYDFNLTRGQLAPDGYTRDMILINGQFPGPTIEANWGDIIQVTVTNSITDSEEGTSLHWHGLLQKTTPWEDGVPGVQQCPIAPGSSFTYTFQADLYGTSWYHSHYSAQYAAGVLGPMIIHGPSNAPYDIDLGPVFLTDWYHREYFDILEDVMGTDLSKIAPASDNNLINGKMNFDCSTVESGDTANCTDNAGLSKFMFTSGKTHRLRLINAGGEGIQRFSIDGHSLTVIANDFVPIQPYTTDVVTLGVGQRTDVLVTANANGTSTSAYWMRSNISSLCSNSNQGEALAAVYYDTANSTLAPTSEAWAYTESDCANDDLSETIPYYELKVNTPTTTYVIDIGAEVNETGNFVWTMNDQTFRVNYDNPVFLQAVEGNLTFSPELNVIDFGNTSTVRIILNNTVAVSHPMHLHGHNMQILASGTGSWDGTITNPSNPQRRDTQLVLPSGYFVFQFDTDNPGVWPFHCHIAWHVSSGLYVNILEQTSLTALYDVPQVISQTCLDWKAWDSDNIVDQIDSGL